MNKKIVLGVLVAALALVIVHPVPWVSAAEEIDAYCVVPQDAVPHGSTVALTIKFSDSDKSNDLIVQGPFKVLRYENGRAIIVDVKRGNDKDAAGKEDPEKPTLTFSVALSPKHKRPAPATESVTLTYFVKHKEGKRGELFTTEREQQVDCEFTVQHESEEPTTPSGGTEGDDAQKSIAPTDLGVTNTGTLPSNKWYFVKEWLRGVRRFFTFGAVNKATLELRITNEKAAEALAVAEAKPDDAEALAKALENYTRAGERLRAQFAKLKETSENPNVEKLIEKLNEQTLIHAVLFDQLAARRDTQAARDNHLQGAVDAAQKKIQDVVLAAAERDKYIEQKAKEQIERAEGAINELGSELAERQTPKRDFGDRMKAGLETAAGVLANAKTLFTEGKFGEAFGQARVAEVHATNFLRALSEAPQPDLGEPEEGTESVVPRQGVDTDTPRIENMNSAMPIVPGSGTAEENTVPVEEQRVFPETNNVASEEAAAVSEEAAPSSAAARGYSFTISGGVFDMTNAPAMTNGAPLSGVPVLATGPVALATQTQSNGSFVLAFRNAPAGTYSVCVTLPSGFTAPSAGDPPCEDVAVELLSDGTTLVFTNNGNMAYYTGTQFNFYAMHR